MALTTVSARVAMALVLLASQAFAQTPTLAPGCTATPAQLEANKKVAMEFFRPGVDRVALADPTYKQHNPAFVKGGREANLSDYGTSSHVSADHLAVAVRVQAQERVVVLQMLRSHRSHRRAIHSRSSWRSAIS